MIQKDYIQRLTQEIAQFLAKLLGFEAENALEYIDEAYREQLDLDLNFRAELTPDNIIDKLVNEKELNVHQLEFVAEIMAKEGTYLKKVERLTEGLDKLQKALIIFEHVEEEQQLFSLERKLTIQEIKNQLSTNERSK